MHALFCRAGHSLISRCGAVVLVALALSSFAFCGCRPVGIHEAAQNGNLERVKELLKANPDLVFNKDNDKGGTPLHWAARSGCKDVAELLLANKADVNAKRQLRQYAFALGGAWWPQRRGGIAAGQQSRCQCQGHNVGWTPLHWAAVNGHKDVAELLLANKAEVNAKDNNG